MSMKSVIAILSVAAMTAPLPVGAQSSVGYRVSLTVPVVCQVRHNAVGTGYDGTAYNLGQLNEYCNAPQGYDLRVHYTPGSLQGMTLMVGERNLILDGSGQAMVRGADMPRIQQSPIIAIPSPSGFDTDRLNFEILPR